ncbi:expressed unknown protein [Seminavis robusta]|uniref:Uncharacterized protein n=1 Tax=Seminavis robusta TaxID=568900 RepID=A0A9N8DLH2_9STRA|nr:expressed unknown protein [Seminavis robusta]|eukprot:Sro220_g090810.1 n/a (389) ;mRNA; r:78899-80065
MRHKAGQWRMTDDASREDGSEAFVKNGREAIIGRLRKAAEWLDQEEDRNKLISSTLALAKTNQEILQRCLPHKLPRQQQQQQQPNPTTATNQVEFYRLGFEVVEVTTTKPVYSYTNPLLQGSPMLKFQTKSEVARRAFTISQKLSTVLNDIIPIPQATTANQQVLPDYENYLSRAILLQDDILILFLLVLKEHLKAIQVSLGEIESWLLEPMHIVQFLNDQFGTQLQLSELQPHPMDTHNNNHNNHQTNIQPGEDDCSTCSKCFHVYVRQQQHPYNAFPQASGGGRRRRSVLQRTWGGDFDLFAHSYNTSSDSYLFPDGTLQYNEADKCPFCGQTTAIASEDNNGNSNNNVIPLKSVSMSDGDITKSFRVSEESDREKLKKFLDFVNA